MRVSAVSSFDTLQPVTITPSTVKITPDKIDDRFRLVMKNVSDKPVVPELLSTQASVIDVELPTEPIAPGREAAIYVKATGPTEAVKKTSFTFAMSDSAATRYSIPVEIGASPRASATKTGVNPTNNLTGRNAIRPTSSKRDTGGK